MARQPYVNITDEDRDEIVKLLKEGHSYVKIGLLVNTNRKTVKRVADSSGILRNSFNLLPNFQRSPERCPECGNKVYLPCLQCRLENES